MTVFVSIFVSGLVGILLSRVAKMVFLTGWNIGLESNHIIFFRHIQPHVAVSFPL